MYLIQNTRTKRYVAILSQGSTSNRRPHHVYTTDPKQALWFHAYEDAAEHAWKEEAVCKLVPVLVHAEKPSAREEMDEEPALRNREVAIELTLGSGSTITTSEIVGERKTREETLAAGLSKFRSRMQAVIDADEKDPKVDVLFKGAVVGWVNVDDIAAAVAEDVFTGDDEGSLDDLFG